MKQPPVNNPISFQTEAIVVPLSEKGSEEALFYPIPVWEHLLFVQ
jgi:hypothetical protein